MRVHSAHDREFFITDGGIPGRVVPPTGDGWVLEELLSTRGHLACLWSRSCTAEPSALEHPAKAWARAWSLAWPAIVKDVVPLPEYQPPPTRETSEPEPRRVVRLATCRRCGGGGRIFKTSKEDGNAYSCECDVCHGTGNVRVRPHIVNGEFQSDKYPTCPPGKVPLSVRDTTAQDLLWEYAQRRREVDAEFSADLEFALRAAGYKPPPTRATEENAE